MPVDVDGTASVLGTYLRFIVRTHAPVVSSWALLRLRRFHELLPAEYRPVLLPTPEMSRWPNENT